MKDSDIRNCGRAKQKSKIVRFTYKCPKNWNTLQQTENDDLRFCDACQSNVYYCVSPQEVNRHAHQGHCVAIASLTSERNAAPAWDIVEDIELGMVEPPRRQTSAMSEFCGNEIETRVYED